MIEMAGKKLYSGGFEEYEKKLRTVMEKIGVEKFNYDWNRQSCFVELICRGRAFRFEKSLEDAERRGERISCVSDLFAQIVLMLEDLARASSRGLFDFAEIVSGLQSLPEGTAGLESCFLNMGFTRRPESVKEVRSRYRQLAKVMHPDVGGDEYVFDLLQKSYQKCMELMGGDA